MVTLDQLLDRVGAKNDPELAHRAELRRVVLETIAALGLLVNTRTGEVYNPAPAPSRIPEDNSRRLYGRRR